MQFRSLARHTRSEQSSARTRLAAPEIDQQDIARAPVDRVFEEFGTSAAGLTTAEAELRRTQYGPNDPAATKRIPAWLQFLARFRNPLVIILLVASGLSAATGDVVSFLIVVTIVALSTGLDFLQEYRAHGAVESLRRSVALHAAARRDGSARSVPVEELVPGDVVELIAGDLVPADARLIESRDLFVNQALMTGESYPVEKRAEPIPDAAGASDAALPLVFAGTSVISGTATAVVYATGRATTLGALAASLAEKPPATAFAVGNFGVIGSQINAPRDIQFALKFLF